MANAGHIPSDSRHCLWTPQGKGRLYRFPRAKSKLDERRTGKTDRQDGQPKVVSTQPGGCPPRHSGDRGPAQSWESEGAVPLGNIPLSERVSSLLGFESAERRSVASYERELAAHKATESELRRALARDQALLRQKDVAIRQQKMLTEECHHRLLNNLQMIVALVSLQARKEVNAETASRLSIAADRVRAIAGLHNHLHSMDGTPTVEFKPYLDLLCRDHSTMSMSDERPDQVIAVDAIELSLPTTIGIPLSLIVNELITNPIKHGRERITMTLAQSAKGHALSVSNGGSHLPEGFDPTASKGVGMTLVSSLAAQTGGELRIDRGDDNDSTRFTVLFA
jgi:two-component sensor histidine kinase